MRLSINDPHVCQCRGFESGKTVYTRIPTTLARPHPSSRTQQSLRPVAVRAKKDGKQQEGFGIQDDLLDFVLAGPKMRKWYGQEERQLPRDGGGEDKPSDSEQDEFEEDDDGDGNAILVTDADTPSGEQVLLQLILARAAIRVLVKDPVATQAAYGPYVYPIRSDTSDARVMRIALKGAGSAVCLGKLGELPKAAKAAGISHIVLLSSTGTTQESGLLSMFSGDGGLSALRDPAREEAVINSGVRYTIVRVGGVVDAPGGQNGLALLPVDVGQGGPQASSSAGGSAQQQRVSREDVAAVIVNALLRPPSTQGRAFQVVPTGSGPAPSSTDDWTSLFEPFGCMTYDQSEE
mmetsp:Transcript_6708/g.17950  ORF Transcript_6708/g.17950 Transcript_6708/m.17950 type:complete len:349 (-) Transcript_6708:1160-2206(-)